MHCLNLSIRYRKAPIHFCFSTHDEAQSALNSLTNAMGATGDGEIVLAQESVGFLKRNFVSVERIDFPDDDDDDRFAEPPGPSPKRKKKKAKRKRVNDRHGLESSLADIVADLHVD
jgi:hypothetical protein